MLARDVIAAALSAAMPPSVVVMPYASNIAPPLKSTVMVRVDKVRPSRHAKGLWEVDAALVLVAAQTAPGPGDDELDALLQDVLMVLDAPEVGAALTWTEATRAVYGDPDPTNPAYEVAVNTQVTKE